MQDDKRVSSIKAHLRDRAERGQALVEYVLLVVLLAVAFGIGLAATGPAITNVFNNTIFSLVNGPTADPDEDRSVRPVDFWEQVTAVAALPDLEQQLPTRTVAPPSLTPTNGPSPTPSPVTPTSTPNPTATPTPSPTPGDFGFLAPHMETVDEPMHWRVGSQPFLGYDKWNAAFYANQNLSGSPSNTVLVEDIHPDGKDEVSFNWGNNSPFPDWPAGNTGNNFTAVFTRRIYIGPGNTTGGELQLNFSVNADDGVRLWLIPFGSSPDTCSATGVAPGDGPSGDNRYGDGTTLGDAEDCLLLDDWNSGDNNGGSVVRTVPESGQFYTLRLDYLEYGGGAKVSLGIGSAANEDDVNVCNWGRDNNEDDANSLPYMWEEYVDGNFNANSTCHLELRGFVYIPTQAEVGDQLYGETVEFLNRPQFEFWNVWDFDNGGHSAYLQIAEYIEDLTIPQDPAGEEFYIDRAQTWAPSNVQTVNLHTGGTNYNWTRESVDLSAYEGQRVTFRFVLQKPNIGGNTRWFIDDIGITNNMELVNDIGTDVGPFEMTESPIDPANRLATDDFIVSGGWEIGNNNIGNTADAWVLLPGDEYSDFSDDTPGGDAGNVYNEHRIYSLMINGVLNPDAVAVDDEGDTGPPVLTFTHRVDVGRRTGLEVQYRDANSTDPADWLPVPGVDPNNPAGRLRDIDQEDSNDRNQMDVIRYAELELELIPVQRYNLRFAVKVRDDADFESGWIIDNIHFHRLDPPRYTDYEFFDDFEEGIDNWRVTAGDWARTTESFYSEQHSITDSPGGNYSDRSEPSIRLLYPIDFNNDTAANQEVTPEDPIAGNTDGAAVNPMMSFWHWRDLDQNDDFYVEWRRINDTDNDWQVLWVYEYGMTTNSNGATSATAVQEAWEYVSLDLEPIIRGTAGGDEEDDDILFRFRLDADNSRTNDGLYIDDVFIGERVDRTVRLWPEGDNPTIGGENFGNGTGATYIADLEGADWENEWIIGGDWTPVDWSLGRRQGLLGFHDSANGQLDAIYGRDDGSKNIDNTARDSYHVLELSSIFDLRATAASETPTLYFWNRYYVGDQDTLRVQVSRELNQTPAQMDADMAARCGTGRPQCYEQERGWSEWNTVWEVGERERNYTWVREQVPLEQYASQDNNTPGQRIRIRFVHNALQDHDNRDGWYIDWVTIDRLQDDVLFDISTTNFFDPARNLGNWVTEGQWGLSPQLFRGSSGGPATLGVWTERWWDCKEDRDNNGTFTNDCNDRLSDSRTLLNNNPNNNNPAPDVERVVLDINYDMRRGAPIPGVFDETDSFYGRWVLETPVIGTGGVQAGEYTFIVVTDDGVRMKAEYWDGSQWINANCELACDGNANNADEWYIVNSWRYRGRTADVGNVFLEGGRQYRLTVEYFESGGDAVMILNTGGNSFSFTDSPVEFAGADDIPASPYGNSSLLLDGTLDLNGTQLPLIQYYTITELGWNDANFEVSLDGGFDWGRDGLDADQVYPSGFIDDSFEDGDYGGYQGWRNNAPDWDRKRHNLVNYAGFQIMIRFRLEYDSNQRDRDGGNDYRASWWITDIAVRDALN